jgi:hypothetical protein
MKDRLLVRLTPWQGGIRVSKLHTSRQCPTLHRVDVQPESKVVAVPSTSYLVTMNQPCGVCGPFAKQPESEEPPALARAAQALPVSEG